MTTSSEYGVNLTKPRWAGGPPVCSVENRLAFEDEKGYAAHVAANCPGYTPTRVWRCVHCGKVHGTASPPHPLATAPAKKKGAK